MRAAEEVSSGYDVELRDTAVVSDIREALASAQSVSSCCLFICIYIYIFSKYSLLLIPEGYPQVY